MSLVDISHKFKTDKFSHGFVDFYNKIFFEYKDKIKSVLEIGILYGFSLELWNEYFPNAKIYGIDLKEKNIKNDNIITFKGRQEDTKFLTNVLQKTGTLDLIIDDGSHNMNHQQISFGFLFKYVNPGGFYIIEDLHTSTDFYNNSVKFNKNESKSNNTLKMIFNYIETNKIKSEYLDDITCKYIEKNIKKCYIFHNNTGKCSITAIFHKK